MCQYCIKFPLPFGEDLLYKSVWKCLKTYPVTSIYIYASLFPFFASRLTQTKPGLSVTLDNHSKWLNPKELPWSAKGSNCFHVSGDTFSRLLKPKLKKDALHPVSESSVSMAPITRGSLVASLPFHQQESFTQTYSCSTWRLQGCEHKETAIFMVHFLFLIHFQITLLLNAPEKYWATKVPSKFFHKMLCKNLNEWYFWPTHYITFPLTY